MRPVLPCENSAGQRSNSAKPNPKNRRHRRLAIPNPVRTAFVKRMRTSPEKTPKHQYRYSRCTTIADLVSSDSAIFQMEKSNKRSCGLLVRPHPALQSCTV